MPVVSLTSSSGELIEKNRKFWVVNETKIINILKCEIQGYGFFDLLFIELGLIC